MCADVWQTTVQTLFVVCTDVWQTTVQTLFFVCTDVSYKQWRADIIKPFVYTDYADATKVKKKTKKNATKVKKKTKKKTQTKKPKAKSRGKKKKTVAPRVTPPDQHEEEADRPALHPPCKIMLTYNFTDPQTDEVKETAYLVPGPAWDTIKDRIVWVIHYDPSDRAFLLLDDVNTPHRSRCHIRAATQRERDSVATPYSDRPARVLNLYNAEPFRKESWEYSQFLKYLRKAKRLCCSVYGPYF